MPVIVLWSAVSITKDWVLEEAQDGQARGILVPVFIERVSPPRGFRRIQAADLTGWDGTPTASSFQSLLHDTEAILGRSATQLEEQQAEREPSLSATTKRQQTPTGAPLFRADAWYLPDEPVLGFVEIPEGPFLMGSDPARDKYATEDETPLHEISLPKYYIARYPVTVRQFSVFHPELMQEMRDSMRAYTEMQEDILAKMRDYHGRDLRIETKEPHTPGPDTPVVVGWRESLAYCDWLREQLRTWDATPDPLANRIRSESWRVTLPSEAEWEKAARGTDGRIYPWGNHASAERANCVEAAVDGISAVGTFPEGASPYGVLDMVGNTWEWTRSHHKGYPYDPDDGREDLDAGVHVQRAVRGGDFVNEFVSLRCACRYGLTLDNRHGEIVGFRVVVSPPPGS